MPSALVLQYGAEVPPIFTQSYVKIELLNTFIGKTDVHINAGLYTMDLCFIVENCIVQRGAPIVALNLVADAAILFRTKSILGCKINSSQ